MNYYDLLGSEYLVGTIKPHVFVDLQLQELLSHVLTEKQTDNVMEVLMHPLSPIGIKQRQGLFLELEKDCIEQFLSDLIKDLYDLQAMFRTYSLHTNSLHKSVYYVDVILKYIEFVTNVCNRKLLEDTASSLLREFIQSFLEIQDSPEFVQLKTEADSLKTELRQIQLVKLDISTPNGTPAKVRLQAEDTLSFADELLSIAQCLEETNKEFRRPHIDWELSYNFINGLSQLYPELFTRLEQFHNNYQKVFTVRLLYYIDQISFFLNMKQLFTALKEHNIPLSMPKVTADKKISINNAYDITLLTKMKSGIIPNDVVFNENQGFYILTGANSGGKTSFLRAIAICQILCLSGCFIPVEKAELYPFQQIFTQFPADESQADTGRLEEEQIRVAEILTDVNEDSLVFLNETFSSTNEQLSLKLSFDLLEELCKIGTFGIFVTHQHQLLDKAKIIKGKTKIGYLTVVVLDDEEKTRTFKIVSKCADTQSHARSILEKYGLTRKSLIEKLSEVEQC